MSIDKTGKKPLVSIIVSVFNAEKFLKDTIKTIKGQTYTNWEAIFIDDCSTDNSAKIIKAEKDPRIKLITKKANSGSAETRNVGISKAKGKYICFLDADDSWKPEKLEKQIAFVEKTDAAFSFTGYEFADENCKPNGKKVFVPEKMNYEQALKNTTIFISTVMFDMSKLSKEDITMPNVRSEDTATWWKVLKKIDYAYGLNEILSYYRRSTNTKSANKLKAINQTWELYRKVEKLNFFKSSYNFSWYAFNAVRRRV